MSEKRETGSDRKQKEGEELKVTEAVEKWSCSGMTEGQGLLTPQDPTSCQEQLRGSTKGDHFPSSFELKKIRLRNPTGMKMYMASLSSLVYLHAKVPGLVSPSINLVQSIGLI